MPEQFYTLESLTADTSVSFLAKRCGITVTQIAEKQFASQSISFNQWMVLMWLTRRAHASPTELSTRLGHDSGTLTRVIDELEREKMVHRERSQSDRRAVQISITPHGRRAARAGKLLQVESLNEILVPFSRAEVDTLISLLQRLLSRLQDTAAGQRDNSLLPPMSPKPAKTTNKKSRRKSVEPGTRA